MTLYIKLKKDQLSMFVNGERIFGIKGKGHRKHFPCLPQKPSFGAATGKDGIGLVYHYISSTR